MATLVLSAVGTAIAGPIGGTIGSLIGSQIDQRIFGPPDREGPRLQELKVTTSSYGTPVPRHFGTMRAAGTVIWAQDLKETSEKTGSKGQPKVTTYSYSASFAVALASRPISRLGRIWADGNLLRGAAGDLKVGGALRVYNGNGNQQPDPLIASAEGGACPAYRGFAYCVFEELQLAEFGNRIPSLTFEVVAEDGTVSLADLLSPVSGEVTASRPLDALEGFSDEGGSLVDTLSAIDRVYPLLGNATGDALEIAAADIASAAPVALPAPIVDRRGEGFGGASGRSEKRSADSDRIPVGLRYYDIERDYQTGMQRAGGQAIQGRNRMIEFPGALRAGPARKLANDAADRARWGLDRLAYRIAEIDTSLSPGQIVSIPGKPGKWRIEAWEWRESGVELELLRLPARTTSAATTEAGRSLAKPDLVATPSLLESFELPWDGTGSPDQRQIFAAASAPSAGWSGAALYAQIGTGLSAIGPSGSQRSIIGILTAPLAANVTPLIDRRNAVQVSLASQDFVLDSCTVDDLASGFNRALIGDEVVQFGKAENLGNGQWRLSLLLRGRGGSEHAAHHGHAAGSRFVLLDERPVRLDSADVGQAGSIAAIGIADSTPALAPISEIGSTLRPLAPVHTSATVLPAGGWLLCWTRRSRGAWSWSGTVDVPLNEQAEAYEVGIGDPAAPTLTWEVTASELLLDAATLALLQAESSGNPLWVRQIGTYARSYPTLIRTIN